MPFAAKAVIDLARILGSQSIAGDLSEPLDLRQHDEVGELAIEINQMCERLAEAQVRLRDETQRRLDASEQLFRRRRTPTASCTSRTPASA
jgi:two-component system, NtrC family, sensor kinase